MDYSRLVSREWDSSQSSFDGDCVGIGQLVLGMEIGREGRVDTLEEE